MTFCLSKCQLDGHLCCFYLLAIINNCYKYLFARIYVFISLGLYEWYFWVSWYFSSVAQACLTICDHINCSMPGLPVHHQLLEFTHTHVHRVRDAIQPSHPLVVPISSRLQSFPASGSFPTSHLLVSGGQSIGVSASTSVPPMNTWD